MSRRKVEEQETFFLYQLKKESIEIVQDSISLKFEFYLYSLDNNIYIFFIIFNKIDFTIFIFQIPFFPILLNVLMRINILK